MVGIGAGVCTLLQTVLAVLTFYRVDAAGLAAILPTLWTCLGAMLAACVIGYVGTKAARSVENRLIAWRLTPIGAPRSDNQTSAYTELVSTQPRLLLMTDEEAASRAGLPVRYIRFLFSRPWFVPRIDVEQRLRPALMVATEWCGGDDYGDECTIARLKWYVQKGVVAYTLLPRLISANPSQRKNVLRLKEKHVRTMLSKKGQAS